MFGCRMMEAFGDLPDTKASAIGKNTLDKRIMGPMKGRGSHKEHQNVNMVEKCVSLTLFSPVEIACSSLGGWSSRGDGGGTTRLPL